MMNGLIISHLVELAVEQAPRKAADPRQKVLDQFLAALTSSTRARISTRLQVDKIITSWISEFSSVVGGFGYLLLRQRHTLADVELRGSMV